MKKNLILFFVLFNIIQTSAQILNEKILVNQEGYNINHSKIAVVKGSFKGAKFYLTHIGTREKVYKDSIKEVKYYFADRDSFSVIDFTNFNKEGDYFINVDGIGRSYDFRIVKNIYKEPFLASLKQFYINRASMEIEKRYSEKYFREAGHLDTNLKFIEVKGKKDSDKWSSPGGWYDAGDFGKYVVNGGVTVGTLLALYEFLPNVIGDSILNIPESGNRISDLLDEIKYEIDWFLTMQDSDGGVFFKIGGKKWPGMIMPSQDNMQRYIIGKSTASTLNFCAVTAMAARIYKPFYKKYANKCLKASLKAWKWANNNRNVLEPDNTEGSGPYRDSEYNDEFLWASTELYITTKDNNYLKTVNSNLLPIHREVWWRDVGNMAYYSIFNHRDSVDTNLVSYVDTNFSFIASQFKNEIKLNGIETDMFIDDYHWGSNGAVFNKSIIPMMWYKKTKDSVLFEAIIKNVDYIFGKNCTSYSMITGFGKKRVIHLHHRQSEADNVYEPVPGLITGGSNQYPTGADKFLVKLISSQTPPAECYVHRADSWASNEPAINQNAPAVFILGALNYYLMR